MVLVWIGLGIGAIVAAILILKIITSPKNNFIATICTKCGMKTSGLKCPLCESEKSNLK